MMRWRGGEGEMGKGALNGEMHCWEANAAWKSDLPEDISLL